MKITQDMIEVFNSRMEDDETILRIAPWQETDNSCHIVPCNMTYIGSFILNPTDDFYETLELFFKERGIRLTYNNTRSIFWPNYLSRPTEG